MYNKTSLISKGKKSILLLPLHTGKRLLFLECLFIVIINIEKIIKRKGGIYYVNEYVKIIKSSKWK